MRLICPNCGAQYDVDDNVIPVGGRDVQCSNCGHTWFQRSAGQDRELVEATDPEQPNEAATAEDEVAQVTETEPDPDHLPEEEFAETDEEASDHLPEDNAGDEYEDEDGEIEERALKRRELDPGVAEILREEAERETAERAEEGGGIETQPDLGLESADSSARDRMAHLRDLPDEEFDAEQDDEEGELTIAAVVAASHRRDLLPDIEEINSTLTATSDRAEAEEDDDEREVKRAKSGFRRGFVISVLFFAALALIYSYAPRLVAAYPGAEPALSGYVDAVNGLRQWVDGMMQLAVQKLTVLLGQVSGDGG